MLRSWKKIVSAFLIAYLICTIIPINVFASNNQDYNSSIKEIAKSQKVRQDGTALDESWVLYFLHQTYDISVNQYLNLRNELITEPSDPILRWTSSDTSIAIVDIYGGVSGIKNGTVTIQVESENQKTSCTVRVGSGNSSTETTTVHRLYNRVTGEHLFTADSNERDTLSRMKNWNYEGIAWRAPSRGNPVYRLYNPSTKYHLFTTDYTEASYLSKNGWSWDNGKKPLFYSGGNLPVFRMYSPASKRHLLTIDGNEYSVLRQKGWNQEGIKLYAVSNK